MVSVPGPRTIAVPRLLHVGPGATRDLGAALLDGFDLAHVLVVTGRDISREIGVRLAAQLEQSGTKVESVCHLEGTTRAAARLLERLDESSVTLVIALGGGRPIDVAKLAATRAGIDLVAVPTVLSHDGMCSPVASLIGADGVRRSVGAAMPAGVVVDTDIVGRAPEQFIRAGLGDLVSNVTAVEDWRRASAASAETVDEFAASIALMSATSVLDIEWPPSAEDVAAIARGLVMSGLAMEVAGSSRPCSGAEHLVSHALDELETGGPMMHGEQVALGVLIVSGVHERSLTEHLLRLMERIGMFSRLAALGIDRSMLTLAVQRGPATRPGRYTVLDEIDLSTDAVEALIDRTVGRRLR